MEIGVEGRFRQDNQSFAVDTAVGRGNVNEEEFTNQEEITQ
jgi:hypothetical protein